VRDLAYWLAGGLFALAVAVVVWLFVALRRERRKPPTPPPAS
jgi:membrane protein implicated in regulation of membrane protease activity